MLQAKRGEVHALGHAEDLKDAADTCAKQRGPREEEGHQT